MGLFRRTNKTAPFGMQAGLIRGAGIGELPRLGTKQLLDGYNIYPWLRAVVDKISEIAGGVEWTVNAKSADGTLKKILNHPLLDLLNGGNSVFSGLTNRTLAVKYLLLVGEFFWLYERNKFGMPIALWPIPPSWVLSAPTFHDDPGAIYRMSFRGWNKDVPASEVFHVWEPNPTLPYGRGSGRAATLSDELETDEYAARFMKSFFVNSARPDILITSEDPENPISPEAAKRMEQSWLEKLQGFWKQHLPYFMTGGRAKVTILSSNAKDMEFIDLRKFSRDVILQMFGFPPEALGIIENSNRATIDAAEYFLTRHVVVPKCTFIREEINHRLVPQFDKRLVTGFVSPVAVDKEQKIEIMKAAPYAFSIDSLLTAAGEEPIGGAEGDLHGIPLNYVMQSLKDATILGDPANHIAPASTDDPAPDNSAPNSSKPGASEPNGTKPKGVEKEVTPAQRRSLAALAALLLSNPDAVLAASWAPVTGSLAALAETFGQAEYDAQGAPSKFMVDAELMQKLNQWKITRGHLINVTTGAQLSAIIAAGIENNDDLATIVANINEYFADLPGGRLLSISQTETGRVSTLAQRSAFSQLGITQSEWLSQRDGKVRETHSELDGQKVAIGGYFRSTSGAEGPGPRMMGDPAEDINCRCFLVGHSEKSKEESYRDARWKQLDSELLFQEKQMEGVFKQAFRRQARAATGRLI